MAKKEEDPNKTRAFELVKALLTENEDGSEPKSYSDAVSALVQGGMDISYPTLASRLQRKSLPLGFVIQICDALGKEIQFVDKPKSNKD